MAREPKSGFDEVKGAEEKVANFKKRKADKKRDDKPANLLDK